jgi:formate dehydrogenase
VWARLDELEASLDAPVAALRLISKRERLGHNSWMHDNPRLSTPSHAVHLSPQDAERLGIRDGDRVRLSANGHSLELPAQVNDELSAGVIAVPHGYGHLAGSSWDTAKARGGQNINQLAAAGTGAVDPLSGMAWLVGVPVELSPVAHDSYPEARAESAE